MVATSTSLAGFAVARRYRDRPRLLRELQSALQALATEISYGATPLPEAFASLARRTRQPIAMLFSTAAAAISQPGQTAYVAWQAGLTALGDEAALTPGDIAILDDLSGVLGLSDRQDQERHLLLAVRQLQQEEAKAQEDRVQNERMWRYLGVLSGLLLVIVLW